MDHANHTAPFPHKWIWVAALAGCLLAAACTGPMPADDADEPEQPADPSEETREPVTRTMEGYRIQIMSTPEKSEADERVAEAINWWDDVPASQRPQYLTSNDLPIDIKYQQPYYRVRLGNFATRQEADRAISLIKNRFADAFIVPDIVTVTR